MESESENLEGSEEDRYIVISWCRCTLSFRPPLFSRQVYEHVFSLLGQQDYGLHRIPGFMLSAVQYNC
jgi:hypothetical protein